MKYKFLHKPSLNYNWVIDLPDGSVGTVSLPIPANLASNHADDIEALVHVIYPEAKLEYDGEVMMIVDWDKNTVNHPFTNEQINVRDMMKLLLRLN